MYRVGLPFWKVVAGLGGKVSIRVNIIWDDETRVFVASSPDLLGLVAEAGDFNELKEEVNNSIHELIDLEMHNNNKNGRTVPRYRIKGLSPA